MLTTLNDDLNSSQTNSYENVTNQTSIVDVSFANSAEIHSWILLIFLGNVGLGGFLNALSFVALCRSKRNGTLSIILQLSGTDVASTCVCFMEIWSLKHDTWLFPPELCPLFSGAEILFNTLTLYLIISLNFHTISLCNLKMEEKARNPLTSCDASNECLVRDSRHITIDYRNRRREVSVIFPCILVWFLCLSLSIPQFTLSSTMKIKNNATICTLVDIYYGKMLQHLLMLFRVFIPGGLLAILLVILTWKLYFTTRENTIQNIFMKKADNVLYYLIFCLSLNVCYLLTSLQRLVLYSLHSFGDVSDSVDIYKMPPFYNNCLFHYLTLLLSMLHYSGTIFRFLIYLFLLPKFKALFCNKILLCFKNKQ